MKRIVPMTTKRNEVFFRAVLVDFNNDEREVLVKAIDAHMAHFAARKACRPECGEKVFYIKSN